MAPGTYRSMTGNRALAWGLLAAAQRTKLPIVFGAYPITPASDILHELALHKRFRVRTFQAEDEIAAVGSVIEFALSSAGSLYRCRPPRACLNLPKSGRKVTEMGDGRWETGDGRWEIAMADGRWRMADGRWPPFPLLSAFCPLPSSALRRFQSSAPQSSPRPTSRYLKQVIA